MKLRRRKTEVTLETSRVLVLRHRRQSAGWCNICRSQVRMLTPDEAAALAEVSIRAIYRMVEAHRLHFDEQGGSLLICLDSLRDFDRRGTT